MHKVLFSLNILIVFLISKTLLLTLRHIKLIFNIKQHGTHKKGNKDTQQPPGKG